jgi:murein DD-endopeptidase MepM/ murein hydrolase activator NlpD
MFLSPLRPPVNVNALQLLLTGEAHLPDGTRVHTTQGYSSGCPDHCHHAWDIGMPTGTPIQAQHSGVVSSAGDSGGSCGIQVVVDGLFGFRTRNCHLSAVATQQGDHVFKGQVIGFSGATGNVTGPHWHGQQAFCSDSSCSALINPKLALGATEVVGWLALLAAVALTAKVMWNL